MQACTHTFKNVLALSSNNTHDKQQINVVVAVAAAICITRLFRFPFFGIEKLFKSNGTKENNDAQYTSTV